MQLLDLREASCECVVFVSDHKRWAALLKTTFADVKQAEVNAMLLLSMMETYVQPVLLHICRGFSADV